MSPIDVAIAFLLMSAIEAAIKPISVVFGQWFLPKVTAEAIVVADRLIPKLLAEGKTGADLEAELRQSMVLLTQDSRWNRRDLSILWRTFDPRILLTRNALNPTPLRARVIDGQEDRYMAPDVTPH